MNQEDGICSNKHIFASPIKSKCAACNVEPNGLIHSIVLLRGPCSRSPINVTQGSEQLVTASGPGLMSRDLPILVTVAVIRNELFSCINLIAELCLVMERAKRCDVCCRACFIFCFLAVAFTPILHNLWLLKRCQLPPWTSLGPGHCSSESGSYIPVRAPCIPKVK